MYMMEYVKPSNNDQVTITCKEHDKILANGIKQLLKEEYFVDVSVAYNDVSFKVHRLILAVFLPTLKEHMNDGLSGVTGASSNLQILNLDYVASAAEDVQALIEFVYSGKVTIPKERVKHFGQLASDLNVESVVKAVGEYWQTEEDLAQENVEEGEKISYAEELNAVCVAVPSDVDKSNRISIVEISFEDSFGTSNENTCESTTKCAPRGSMDDANDFAVTADAQSFVHVISTKSTAHATTKQKVSRVLTETDHEDEMSESEREAASDSSDWTSAVAEVEQTSASTRKRPRLSSGLKDKDDIDHFYQQVFQRLEEAKATSMRLDNKPCIEKLNVPDKRAEICGKQRMRICDMCGHRSETLVDHRKHLKAVHNKGVPAEKAKVIFKCPQCNFVSNYKHNLRHHFIRKHTDDKKHQCPECDYSAIFKIEIDNHVSRYHRKETKHMCDICGSRYQMKGALNHHVLTKHQGIKPHKCDYCDKAYTDKHHLNEHIRTKHTDDAERQVCSVCGNSYVKRSGLQYHMKHAHGMSLEPLRKPHIPRQPETANKEVSTEDIATVLLPAGFLTTNIEVYTAAMSVPQCADLEGS